MAVACLRCTFNLPASTKVVARFESAHCRLHKSIALRNLSDILLWRLASPWQAHVPCLRERTLHWRFLQEVVSSRCWVSSSRGPPSMVPWDPASCFTKEPTDRPRPILSNGLCG